MSWTLSWGKRGRLRHAAQTQPATSWRSGMPYFGLPAILGPKNRRRNRHQGGHRKHMLSAAEEPVSKAQKSEPNDKANDVEGLEHRRRKEAGAVAVDPV